VTEIGFVSIIEKIGYYWLFSREIKFEKTHSIYFTFGSSWVTCGFKLLANQERLFILTSRCFGLLNTLSKSVVYSGSFKNSEHLIAERFAISHNEKLLAFSFSVADYTDLVTDEVKFKNYIRIHDISSGKAIGYYLLSSKDDIWTEIQFSGDGRRLI